MKSIFLFAFLCFGLILISCSDNPTVVLKTEYGDIVCEIYKDRAPITANNFLRYIDERRFDGATFYRTVTLENQPQNKVKIEVVQGGLFDDVHPNHLKPIVHETTESTGIFHKDGVISMARNEPGTAMADFFICVGDQPELDFGGKRNPDGQGFAAFGRVISGMDVVQRIHQLKSTNQYLITPVIIQSIVSVN